MSLVKPIGVINSILGEYIKRLNYQFGTATSELEMHLPDDDNWDDSDLGDFDTLYGRIMNGSEAPETGIGSEFKYPYYLGLIPMWGQMVKKNLVYDQFTTLAWVVSGVAVPNEYGVFSPDYLYNKAMSFTGVNLL